MVMAHVHVVCQSKVGSSKLHTLLGIQYIHVFFLNKRIHACIHKHCHPIRRWTDQETLVQDRASSRAHAYRMYTLSN